MAKGKIYAYARVSTPRQRVEQQVRNILLAFPTAVVFCEVGTGTKFEGREELDKMLRLVKSGDTIVFDSASRMSRNEEEGAELYEELFYKGINLIFLKESHINTSVYREAIDRQIALQVKTGDEATDTFIEAILDALNKYAVSLARQQVRLAFRQAEKEVADLRQRTREGLVTAKLNGKKLGRRQGVRVETKKSIQAKAVIKRTNRDFCGSLNDRDTMTLAQVSRNSFYKYKKELLEEEICVQN